jgi:hypothetical protein
MEETAFTNMLFSFCHRMTYCLLFVIKSQNDCVIFLSHYTQDTFSNKHHSEYHPLVVSTAKQEGKTSRVTAKALLSLVAYSG